MSKQLPDGSILYRPPDAPADVTFNGVSVTDLLLEEILVQPDGWGRILCQKELGKANTPVKTWVDGQTRNHQYWGAVVVTL